MARRIIDLFPRHIHYVEPYAGGLAVLLSRDPQDARFLISPNQGVSELVNDIDGRLINFWRVLRDLPAFAEFQRLAEATPFARDVWKEAVAMGKNSSRNSGVLSVQDAWAFFVEVRQSLAGRRSSFSPITRTRTRRGMNGNTSEWLSSVEGLDQVHARLKSVLIENKPALDLLVSEDSKDTLFYLDPPYLPQSRTAKAVYQHEMTHEEHETLLAAVCKVKGKVILSGYPSQLYDKHLAHWRREEFDIANHASGKSVKKRKCEVLWCNF